MPADLITETTMYWADLGDNRIGPLMRELIVALAESEDHHLVRRVARRVRLLSSSLDAMSHRMAAEDYHDKHTCPPMQTRECLLTRFPSPATTKPHGEDAAGL